MVLHAGMVAISDQRTIGAMERRRADRNKHRAAANSVEEPGHRLCRQPDGGQPDGLPQTTLRADHRRAVCQSITTQARLRQRPNRRTLSRSVADYIQLWRDAL